MITGIPDNKRGIERLAGLTGLLISFLMASAILSNLDIDPDLNSIHEDLAYFGENIGRLGTDTLIWFINAILIILFGPLIMMSFLSRGRSSSCVAAFLISSTGVLCLAYAINSYNAICLLKDYLETPGEESEIVAGLIYHILVTKANLQGAVYTLAGLSAMILGLLIARTALVSRFIGWMAFSGGLIYVSLGWVNTENLLFTLGRLLFILSLILLGSTLMLKGLTKRKSKPDSGKKYQDHS